MSLDVEIDNLQAFSRARFEIEGFCGLTGPTDEGKSALVRILRGALTNTIHKSWIRRGAREGRVRVRFAGEAHPVAGFEVTKSARGGTGYVISLRDGGTAAYPEIGDDLPPELRALGLADVLTGRDGAEGRFSRQFQMQPDPLHLVTLGEPALTRFLIHVFRIDRHERAARAMITALQGVRRECDQRALRLSAAEIEHGEALSDAEAAAESLARLDAAQVRFDAASTAHARAEQALAGLRAAVASVEATGPRRAALRHLLPATIQVEAALARHLGARFALQALRTRGRAAAAATARLDALREVLPRLGALDEALKRAARAASLARALAAQQALLDGLRARGARLREMPALLDAAEAELCRTLGACPLCGAGLAAR